MSGYPWLDGDMLYAEDLNAAIEAASSGSAGGPFLQLSGGTVTGPLTIQYPNVYSGSAWTPYFYLNTSLSGTTAAGSIANLHQITVNSDTLDTSGSALRLINYSAVNASFGGAAMTGFRQGLDVQINLVAPSGNPRGANYVGITGAAQASASDNGTGLTQSTAAGAVFGANFYASIGGACQNFGGVVGIEVNPAIGTGTTCCGLTGIQVIPTTTHQVRGAAHWDVGYILLSQPSAQAIDMGYVVGGSQGGSAWPIRSDGSLFRGALGYSGGAVARHGVLLNEVSFPAFGSGPRGGAFVSNAFAVDGLGAIQCGPAYLTPTSTGMTIDVTGSVGTGTPTIAAGGTGYTTGDVLYDGFGGVYTVTASGGAVTAVAVLTGANGEAHRPWCPTHTPPTNPVATTTWAYAITASGCTLNLTWDTSRAALSLNPTGQRIGFNGTAPIAKPTVTGSKGANAALASLLTALANYGLVTDSST